MDKKNTMLLTVVAVATLLVAVVGATFAFFTANNSVGGTTTVTATTEAVGTVTLSGGAALTLALDENDMTSAAAGATGKTYWATTTGNYATSQEDVIASKVTVANGEAGTVYNCSYTLKVTQTGDAADLKAGDASLVLTAGSDVTINGVTGPIDFKDLAASYTVEFDQTGNVTDRTLVEAAVSFTNKAEGQDYFAGKDFGLTIVNEGMNCTIAD